MLYWVLNATCSMVNSTPSASLADEELGDGRYYVRGIGILD